MYTLQKHKLLYSPSPKRHFDITTDDFLKTANHISKIDEDSDFHIVFKPFLSPNSSHNSGQSITDVLSAWPKVLQISFRHSVVSEILTISS
jgi:hypothetical protein